LPFNLLANGLSTRTGVGSEKANELQARVFEVDHAATRTNGRKDGVVMGHPRCVLLMLSVPVLACVVVAEAQVTVDLGSIAGSRFGTNFTLDGLAMDEVRSKLENPANFGLGGTVPHSINITDTAATIDATLLAQLDAFFIGWLGDGHSNAFTPDELNAFSTWVDGGGVMVITCDDVGHDAVCAHFGFPVDGDSLPPHEPVGAALGHTAFHGPFGTLTSFGGLGLSGHFANAATGTVLAVDVSGVLPVVVEHRIGEGRIVVLGDFDMIGDNLLSPGNGIDPANTNDVFCANLFAYATGALMVDGFESGDLSRWSQTIP
jgi:hypothetical protein